MPEVKCPLCQSENVIYRCYQGESAWNSCLDCSIAWTDWQQSQIEQQAKEIESLKSELATGNRLYAQLTDRMRDVELELTRLRKFEEACKEIEEHEHQNSGCRYTGGLRELELPVDVNRGTAKGHRCCAEIARKAREGK